MWLRITMHATCWLCCTMPAQSEIRMHVYTPCIINAWYVVEFRLSCTSKTTDNLIMRLCWTMPEYRSWCIWYSLCVGSRCCSTHATPYMNHTLHYWTPPCGCLAKTKFTTLLSTNATLITQRDWRWYVLRQQFTLSTYHPNQRHVVLRTHGTAHHAALKDQFYSVCCGPLLVAVWMSDGDHKWLQVVQIYPSGYQG